MTVGSFHGLEVSGERQRGKRTVKRKEIAFGMTEIPERSGGLDRGNGKP